MIWHHIQALSKVEGLGEVLLIGFYEDAVMAPFIKDVSRDFPNLAIRYVTLRWSTYCGPFRGFHTDGIDCVLDRQLTTKTDESLTYRYLREYTSLGTAGGLYHFRDAILKGSPSQIFVIHADICFSYPLSEMTAFHNNHRGVGTILGVKVSLVSWSNSRRLGQSLMRCILHRCGHPLNRFLASQLQSMDVS